MISKPIIDVESYLSRICPGCSKSYPIHRASCPKCSLMLGKSFDSDRMDEDVKRLADIKAGKLEVLHGHLRELFKGYKSLAPYVEYDAILRIIDAISSELIRLKGKIREAKLLYPALSDALVNADGLLDGKLGEIGSLKRIMAKSPKANPVKNLLELYGREYSTYNGLLADSELHKGEIGPEYRELLGHSDRMAGIINEINTILAVLDSQKELLDNYERVKVAESKDPNDGSGRIADSRRLLEYRCVFDALKNIFNFEIVEYAEPPKNVFRKPKGLPKRGKLSKIKAKLKKIGGRKRK